MSLRPSTFVLPLLAAATLAACAPGINIRRYRPATYNLGATRSVAMLNVGGPPESIGVVAHELASQISQNGYFRLYNTQPAAMTIVVLPGATVVQNIETVRSAVPAEVYITASVTRWDYYEEEKGEQVAEDGRMVTKVFRIPHAKVGIYFQVIKAATGQLVVAREYTEHEEADKVAPGQHMPRPADVIAKAAHDAVSSFLWQITPTTVEEKIVLDDDEPALEEGINLCKTGRLDLAMQSFEKVLAKSPNSPGAHYNLGVMHEARGDYDRAAELYKKAYELEKKDLYQEALQDMQRRIAEDAALSRPL